MGSADIRSILREKKQEVVYVGVDNFSCEMGFRRETIFPVSLVMFDAGVANNKPHDRSI